MPMPDTMGQKKMKRRSKHQPHRTVAATEVAAGCGKFVVTEGDVLGPIIARFPRTAEGHAAAIAFAAEKS
jgi:hypothetical protein